MFGDKEIKRARIDSEAEFKRMLIQSPAREVAGKSIGRWGLLSIVVIVVIGVVASLHLEESKMAAVMGLLGASLTALISMLNGIAGTAPKQERPEFEVMKQLIERLDRMADRDPMSVQVEGDRVTVRKGDNEVTTGR
jgi:hypothetical protein